jgi:hypothetical protein
VKFCWLTGTCIFPPVHESTDVMGRGKGLRHCGTQSLMTYRQHTCSGRFVGMVLVKASTCEE